MNLKKEFSGLDGFEPVTFAIPVQMKKKNLFYSFAWHIAISQAFLILALRVLFVIINAEKVTFFFVLTGMEVEDKDVFSYEDEVIKDKLTDTKTL